MSNTDWTTVLQQAGLPCTEAYEVTNPYGVVSVAATFERELTDIEQGTLESILDPDKFKKRQSITDIDNIPGWATWEPADLSNWTNINLMSDADIDATNLSAALKTNIQALNDFVRKSGILILRQRDLIVYLLKKLNE